MTDPFSDVRHVERLDVDALIPGTVSRLSVEVAHDGMGRAIALPVLVMRGRRPGPVVGLTAAVHGDELNGIPLMHRLFQRTDPAALKGTLVGVVVVNIPGFLQHRRLFSDRFDLNHLFPGKADGNGPQMFAARLMDRVVRRFDYLFDLHTASFGRVNTLYVRADLSDPQAGRMARLQRPRIILDNPPTDGTLRGAAHSEGIPAITVEIGDPQRFQPNFVRRTLAGIRAVLCDLSMLPRRKLPELPETVVCSQSRWLFTDHGGLLDVFPAVGDLVAEGEAVARLTSIFGDVIREYRAPEPGIVIGKSVNPVAGTGARILHLGRVA